MKTRISGLLLCAVWPLSTVVTAAEDTEQLSGLTVTASPLAHDSLELAQPVRVIAGEALQNRKAATLGETLAREPGVSSSDFGQGASRPVIRGLGAQRVKLLTNGLDSMDLSVNSPDHAVGIEPWHSEQIEILRGPATLLYGSGAIGGVVNVVNNRIPTAPLTGVEGSLDLFTTTVDDGYGTAGSVDAGNGEWVGHIDFLHRDTEDYDIDGFAEAEPDPGEESGKVENSATEHTNYAVGGSWHGARAMLGMATQRIDREYGLPGAHGHGHGGGGGGGPTIDLDQRRHELKALLYDPLWLFSEFELSAAYTDYRHNEVEADGEIATRFDSRAWEARFEATHDRVSGWQGAVGVQASGRDLSVTGEESYLAEAVTSESVGVFIVEERDFGADHIELGMRLEHSSETPAVSQPKISHDLYSLSAGWIREFSPQYSIGFAIARAQRAPTVEELYALGPHLASNTFEIGSTALGEETANSLDLTLRGRHQRLQWQVNLFVNYIEDFIYGSERDRNGDGIADRVEEDGSLTLEDDELLLIRQQQHNALFYGFEAEAVLGLWDDQRGTLDWRVFVDRVRGELEGGEVLPRITPMRIGTGLDYQREAWTAGIDVMQVFAQQDSTALEGDSEAYTRLDLHVAYTLPFKGADYRLYLRGSNLLDDEIRRHTSYLRDDVPQPGRSAMLGLQVSF